MKLITLSLTALVVLANAGEKSAKRGGFSISGSARGKAYGKLESSVKLPGFNKKTASISGAAGASTAAKGSFGGDGWGDPKLKGFNGFVGSGINYGELVGSATGLGTHKIAGGSSGQGGIGKFDGSGKTPKTKDGVFDVFGKFNSGSFKNHARSPFDSFGEDTVSLAQTLYSVFPWQVNRDLDRYPWQVYSDLPVLDLSSRTFEVYPEYDPTFENIFRNVYYPLTESLPWDPFGFFASPPPALTHYNWNWVYEDNGMSQDFFRYTNFFSDY